MRIWNAFFLVVMMFSALAVVRADEAEKVDIDKLIDQYNEAIPAYAESLKAWSQNAYFHLWRGELGDATADIVQAAQAFTLYANGYRNRGLAYSYKGDQDKAIVDFNEALRLNPGDALGFSGRGYAFYRLGKLDLAIADYTKSIRLSPKDAETFWNRGCAYRDKGEYRKAIADCSEAVRLKSDHFEAYYSRGNVHDKKKEFREAAADYSEVIRLRPDYAEAYCCRGIDYFEMAEYEKSLADLKEAIRLQPENAKYYNNLAWALATCPDSKYRNGKEALLNAKRACELDGEKTWQYLGSLAAAYAETGDFEKAAEVEERVVKIADAKSKAECRSQLELYKQGKPFHEEAKK